jgi:exopolysaccharide production protein ExoZ
MHTATSLKPAEPAGVGTIEGIQWLRAVAALMVVMFHARLSVKGSEGWPAFGAAGVDIFFIISGFVMAHTMRHLAPSSSLPQRLTEAGDFVRKRLARVVPLYWVALMWTARRDIAQGTVNLDLLKDIAFVPHPNTSYPDQLWPMMIQGWTLNYEMFFYALFALSMLFGRPRTIVLLAGLGLLVALGPFLLAATSSADPSTWVSAASRFYTDNILLEFGLGVLLQQAVQRWHQPRWQRVVYIAWALLGFVLLALGHDRAPRALTQGLPAMLIVWASLAACRGLRSRVLELLADASYAIYLFHWASFGAVKPIAAWLTRIDAYSAGPQALQVTVLMLLHLTVAIVSGVLVHLWIERPLVRVAQQALGARQATRPAAAAA